MYQFELYFGGRQGNELIPGSAIDAFILASVASRFQGYSVYSIAGYWQGLSEPCIVVRACSELASDKLVCSAIAEEYAAKFSQDCVLLTDTHINAEFIGAKKGISETWQQNNASAIQ